VPSSDPSRLTPFPLKNRSARVIGQEIQTFWASRYPPETSAGNQIRIVVDDSSNTIFVQAAPGDLADIAALIARVDTFENPSKNELRIVPLRAAVSDDLAALLLRAISQGVLPPTAATAAPGQAAAGQQRSVTTTKTTALNFVSTRGDGRTASSGFLEDVQILSDPRTNALLISAPAKTMELLLLLVRELDVVPTSTAQINVFPIKKGDALTMAQMLQQLLLGTGGVGTRTATPAGPGPAVPTAPGVTTTVRPLLISTTGVSPEGAPLIDLRITADDRTNSVIAVGSPNDLLVIQALITRLEAADVGDRRNAVYTLRNSTAVDVANALTTFVTTALNIYRTNGQNPPYLDIEREIVVVAEPITNKLLVSATARWYPEVEQLIRELDADQPMVMIQCTLAEVDLTGNEEFGVEIGLQTPVLFQRGVIPAPGFFGTGTSSFTNATGGLVPPGVTVTGTVNPAAQPGFNFNSPSVPLGNNPAASPSLIGYQGLGSLGVGRVSPTSGVGGFVFSAASDTFNLLIRALRQQGRLDILSRPQVMTLNNQQASVLVGQSIPYISGSNVTATGLVTNTILYRDVGVQMTVTPQISPDGRVVMRVVPEVSSVANTTTPIGNGTTATAFNVQNIQTTVVAMNGETVAIGGLISMHDTKQENKFPWLGDLPYIGAAFRYRTQTKTKTELLVILTPRVVRNRMEGDRLMAEEAHKMDWVLGDVAKVHGPQNLANLLPPPAPEAAVDGAMQGPTTLPPPVPLMQQPPPMQPAQQQTLPPPKPALPVQGRGPALPQQMPQGAPLPQPQPLPQQQPQQPPPQQQPQPQALGAPQVTPMSATSQPVPGGVPVNVLGVAPQAAAPAQGREALKWGEVGR
jgi:type II secretion system protein D